ncbi:dTDP-4-dehydrorhamnose reductase [Caulobacter segnis]|uniref:dTDP-4-dehydrorhamnose reductase n=2 Tax=Caulobacter segnis TaxID=88688 RepID=D5VPV5_CAUST|nr:dTDP-4-dehydrorhamnose reductase [Caulobacter segnis]ADG12528.1 dTDP-4-dehydrorhamnose reductase [Caulobacter segnis ATCC 21756]AVQ04104.1 dTDP-4-dehydrorhamnose reductase [Caulobacter segnis]
MAGPRIALFGANGQLGSDISTLAAQRGLDLVPVTRAQLDASDPTPSFDGLAFDVAINCVAVTRVDDCEKDPAPAVAINAHFAGRLARACAARGARLVQVSTDYVYGGQAQREPLSEEIGRAPVNVYGATKALGEDLARLEHDDVIVARVASLFGVAGASGKGGNFVETMLRLGQERGRLTVVADQMMSPTGSWDAGEAILDLIAAEAPAGDYHVVNSGAASWWDFAARIIERAGIAAEVAPIPTSDFPTPARRPPYSALSNAKLSTAIGRSTPHWTDALDRYLRAKGRI